MLVDRFRRNPKPMYYQPDFLDRIWPEYKAAKSIARDDDVDPDDFLTWGFERLLHHRIPLYRSIAQKYGYVIRMEDVPGLGDEAAFLERLSRIIDGN
jgi:hypothetical protein